MSHGRGTEPLPDPFVKRQTFLGDPMNAILPFGLVQEPVQDPFIPALTLVRLRKMSSPIYIDMTCVGYKFSLLAAPVALDLEQRRRTLLTSFDHSLEERLCQQALSGSHHATPSRIARIKRGLDPRQVLSIREPKPRLKIHHEQAQCFLLRR